MIAHRKSSCALELPLAALTLVTGLLALHPAEWPASSLSSRLELHVLFALAIGASFMADAEQLPWTGTCCEMRQALRAVTRKAYFKLYFIVGLDEMLAWMHGALGSPEDLQDLRFLVAFGVASTLIARFAVGMRARKLPVGVRRLAVRSGG